MSSLYQVKDLVKRVGISLESYLATPTREKEFTMYIELANVNDLNSLAVDKEKHEQWKFALNAHINGSMRLRATNDRRYEITSKNYISDIESIETTSLITKPAFDQLKPFCKDGYYKTRYIIPVANTDLKWEFDVFFGQNGAPHPWAKLDLEVRDLETQIPDIPIPFKHLILANDADLSATQKAKIDALWNKEWQRIENV